MVDVEFVEAFDEIVSLGEIKEREDLADMVLVNRPRLSVQPVTPEEFRTVRKMGRRK
jgi:predicted RNA-binding protein with PUA-like domain